MEITPAKLIQIILVLNDINKIVGILNKYKSFDDVSVEKIMGYKCPTISATGEVKMKMIHLMTLTKNHLILNSKRNII